MRHESARRARRFFAIEREIAGIAAVCGLLFPARIPTKSWSASPVDPADAAVAASARLLAYPSMEMTMNRSTLRSWTVLAASAALFASAAACGSTSSSSPSSTVSAIALSPNPCAVGKSDSKQMSALATLPDGTKKDITNDPGTTWSTGNTSTATVNGTGTVVGVNAGVTGITAEYQGASGKVDCTVGL